MLAVQVGEMCFIEVTLRVSFELPDVPEAPAVPLELVLGVVVPLTWILWPTCSLHFEVSPLSCQVLPELSVSV